MALAIRSASSQQISCTMNVTNSERVLKTFCKARGYEKPVYRISSRSSAWIDGRVYRFKHYLATVAVNGHQLAEGDGFSKRIARKKAAMLGLQQLRVLELQNFWQDYRRVFPVPNQDTRSNFSSQAALNSQNPLTITEIPELASSSTMNVYPNIEEFLPTESLTPTDSLVFNMTGMPVTIREDTGEIRHLNIPKERTLSVDSSSNLLIAAAIEKLKAFRDDDAAGWNEKEKANQDGEEDEEDGKPKGAGFSDDDLKLFNEIKQNPLAKCTRPSGVGRKNDIQQLISGVAEEIETFDEDVSYNDIGDDRDHDHDDGTDL